MNIVKKQLESIKSKLENKLEKRVMLFDEHSEKWQESEIGEAFQEKTDELDGVIGDLEMTIESLDNYTRDRE